MLLIKLGGSVITNKERECTFLPKRTRRLIEELRYIDEPMIITHGGGSFGHKKASHYHLKEGLLDEKKETGIDQVKGFSEVQKDMRDLNNLVMDMMTNADMKVVSVPTASIVTFSAGKLSKIEFKMFDKVLSMGAIPVSFGDVVFDTKLTFTICSADDLMVRLAKRYKPTRVVFVTDQDGLFDSDPDENPNALLVRQIKSIRDVPKAAKKGPKRAGSKDVTGGMISKTKAALDIASMGFDTWFVNGCIEDRTSRVLKGYDVVGTKFLAKKPKGTTKGRKRSKAKSKGRRRK
jgi:isopentenyl phosphate kinase